MEDDKNDELIWLTLRTIANNPEALTTCAKCKTAVLIHPNYTNAGICGCTKCFNKIDIAKKMIEFRGWKFIKMDDNNKKVYYQCENTSHICEVLLSTLRKGGKCLKCANKATKIKKEFKKLERANCNCGTGRKSRSKTREFCRPVVCEHHNHAVCFPDSAKQWNSELNKPITPKDIAPCAEKEYWWTCPNEWCKMNYQQTPHSRTSEGAGDFCPFCCGHKVCNWNCLQTKHPELMREWDPDNIIKPTEVTYCSTIKVKWICFINPTHKWETNIGKRSNGKTGCPHCGVRYAQLTGGHEYFVQEARKIHGDKYSYPEAYIKGDILINIYCPVINDEGEVHGNFPQTPTVHKAGHGCPKCAHNYDQRVGGHDYFVKEARKIHGDKYEYLEEYIKSDIKINIFCPVISKKGKEHGNFPQTPHMHKLGYGCPKCANEATESKIVKHVQELLDQLGYKLYENCLSEQPFDGLKHKNSLKIDRYLPDERIFIEVDGQFHFRVSEYYGGEEILRKNKIRDVVKDKYALKEGYHMIRIPYTIKPDLEYIKSLIDLCKNSNKTVYISYREYYDEVAKEIDMSNYCCGILDNP